jgi:hypothetical protein
MAVVSNMNPFGRAARRSTALGRATVLGCALLACAHDARRAERSPSPAAWIDRDLADDSVRDEPEVLAQLAQSGTTGRVVRLDRLLDLVDAARFSGDTDARETLWDALGGHQTGRGAEATREAWLRLLNEALALEDAKDLDDDARAFLADAIQLLSVDLELPANADDLQIRTLAYRGLAEGGHARVVDNARWRLYDHVFGSLSGAVEAQPERRMDVAVHALHAERDSIEAYLDDAAPHAQPSWPSNARLWSLLEDQRDALASSPRWTTVLRGRAQAERELQDTLMTVLPARRAETWPLRSVPAGAGRRESLAPVLLLERDRAIVDAGRPQGRTVPTARADQLARSIQGTLTQDGRGILLVVADAMLPSPDLSAALAAAAAANVARLELAVREPRVPSKAGHVVTALPVEIGRVSDLGPGAKAIREARIRVHLTGRGPLFAIDERWLTSRPEGARDLEALLKLLDRAFPRERVVAMTVADDVLYQQLLDMVLALSQGPSPHYEAVGWLPDGTSAPKPGTRANDKVLKARAALYVEDPQHAIEQPFPLRERDQKRLQKLARELFRCLPELETKLPTQGRVKVSLSFEEGRLSRIEPERVRGIRARRLDALRDCIRDQAHGFRLREHRDLVEVRVVLDRG